ncbi:MAG TPA: UPF0182 family protein [Terracidiphilus sp.]|nr:UPF0182 family protein [Terracidiphilus sp.]
MYETIDWPKRGNPRRANRGLLILILVLAFVFLSSRTAISCWVNLLWFRSLGYGDVFLRTLSLEWGVFAIFALATFLILYFAFTLLKSAHHNDLPSDHTVYFAGRQVNLSIKPVLRIVALLGSILIAVISGAAMAAQWPTLALFRFAQTGGAVDPIFGKPLTFFLFTLPAWDLISGWLLALAVIIALIALVFFLVSGGSRALAERRMTYLELPWRGLSLAAALLLVIIAWREYIARFELIFEHHTIFDGVNYTDAHVQLGGMMAICVALVLGALIAGITAFVSPRGRWLIASIAPAAVCYFVVGIVSWYVSNFIVKPNQLVRERPYIADNIQMTRQAFGLDRFVQREFPAETTLEAADPANNQATLQNIRLWDWRALQDTLRQIQEIRTYYDFPDIDIDRYTINGAPRQVMLATRELNLDKLPESSRNWINDKLIYTHGYGITMNPVNGFTPEGLPTLMLSNMPVQSTVAGLNVTQPEIYFGEMTTGDVYVKTHQQEFNYPQGQTNNLTSYQGTGGIVLGGFLRRVFIAFDRGDVTKLPFSDDVTPESRLLMRREIRARVQALAPFLTFEHDPYIVLGDDGHLSWIIDAFTSSDNYPYASHYGLGNSSVNYMRNSVKAVIDAYNGTVTFYVFDSEDPILATYRRIFPSLFKDASTMPSDLRRHVRYPESLFTLQADVYGLYHMTDPEVFYNREDLWTVASEVGMADSGEQATLAMLPNFVLMRLPGETSEEFVEILPFTPANRNNLIGWIAGRSDGAHYGTSVVYDFPKTRLVDGPLQIEARIDQNAQISGQLTLWNQQGSHVRRGTLLVIPTGRALLYAEPIYLQAERSPMPELRLVVLALQDKLAYGPTYEAALNSLFGGAASSLTSTEGPPAAAGSAQTTQAASDLHSLINQAAKNLEDYQRLTSEGKLGQAGQKLEDLKSVIGQLNALPKK